MLILHGDNIVLSRNKLQELIATATQKKQTVLRLEAKKLNLATLEEALHSDSLFGEEKLVILEGLHSLPTSNRKKELINYLSTINHQSSTIILYETKTLTTTMLKKFPGSQALEFKLSNSLWKFLDGLGDGNVKTQNLASLHQAIAQNDEFMVLSMIIRQIRLLIQAKEGKVKGAPFMITKLKAQARHFSLEKLLELHQKLFALDLSLKTSQNNLDLGKELDLFLISM